MGSEQREDDAGSTRRRRNTDPGVGPPSTPGFPAGLAAGGGEEAVTANGPVSNDDEDQPQRPEVVDFDALNAALGALPPPPIPSSPAIGESQGRSSATYASARPHTIPPSHAPSEDELNAPAVIVQTDDTIPSGPPNMTLPMGPGVGVVSGPHPAAGMPPSPPSPFTPQRIRLQGPPSGDNVNVTVPMAERPRRPRSPTVVVRAREPTKGQQFAVFLAMLIVFVAGGIALLVYYKAVDIAVLTGAQPPAARSQAPLPSRPSTPSTSALAPSITTAAPVASVPVMTPSALPSVSASATATTTTTTTAPVTKKPGSGTRAR